MTRPSGAVLKGTPGATSKATESALLVTHSARTLTAGPCHISPGEGSETGARRSRRPFSYLPPETFRFGVQSAPQKRETTTGDRAWPN
jgi:hypothetical protein